MKTRSQLKHAVGTGISEGEGSVAPSTEAKAWCDTDAMLDILEVWIPYLRHGVKSSEVAKIADTKGGNTDAGTTLLIMACSIGCTKAVQDLLRLGADRSLSGKECFVEGNRNETFPLEVACINHNAAIVQLLLAAGEDVNRAGLYGRTALHAAALLGHEELTDVLLSHPGIEVNKVDDAGSTALQVACGRKHAKIACALLNCGSSNVNQANTSNGYTALLVACQKGLLSTVKALVKRGARTNVRNNRGMTTLTATENFSPNSVAIYRYLLENGAAEVVSSGYEGGDGDSPWYMTPLHMAAFSENIDSAFATAQLLIVYGADVDDRYKMWDNEESIEAMEEIELFGFPQSEPQDYPPFVNDTAAEIAENKGNVKLANWLNAVAGWSPLKAAAGCRLVHDAKMALRTGAIDVEVATDDADDEGTARLLDTRMLLDLVATAETSGNKLPWENAPDVCMLTVKLMKAAIRGWWPTTHWIHHAGVREAVRVVLHVSAQLSRSVPRDSQRQTRATTALVRARHQNGVLSGSTTLPTLPAEIWLLIMSFFLRMDWRVPSK